MNDTVTATRKERRVRINSECHDFILERKIDDITYGLQPEYSRLLQTISIENALTIGNYIQAMKVEINLSDHYRRDIIRLLCTLSCYNNSRSF